VVLGRRNC